MCSFIIFQYSRVLWFFNDLNLLLFSSSNRLLLYDNVSLYCLLSVLRLFL